MPAPVATGGQFAIATLQTAANQDNPHIATLSDGRFVVVWRDAGTSASTVKYKILNADGSVSVAETIVNAGNGNGLNAAGVVGVGNEGSALAVAALTGGGFAVTWQWRPAAGQDDIFYRVYGANNAALTGVLQANAVAPDSQSHPDIVALNSDRFAIAWSDLNTTVTGVTDSTGIVIRSFAANGAAEAPAVRISDALGGDAYAALAYKSSLNFTNVVWDDNAGQPTFSQPGIYGIEYGAAGAAGTYRSDASLGAASVAAHRNPDTAYELTSVRFLNVWVHQGASGFEIRGAIDNGASFVVSTTPLGSQFMTPSVTALKGGGWAVFWSDGGADGVGGTDADVVGRVVTNFNTFDGGEFVVTSEATTNSTISSLEASTALDGRVLVTWETSGPSSNGFDTFARFVETRTAAVNWQGTAANEQYVGTDFNDVLNGGLGVDVLYGGNGNDTYYITDRNAQNVLIDSTIETATGGVDVIATTWGINLFEARFDNIENAFGYGTANVNLIGDQLANRLTGNAGSNFVAGRGGKDLLWGAGGADKFVYVVAADTGATAATRDVIHDFEVNVDRIDLGQIDTNTALVGDQGFFFRVGAGAAFLIGGTPQVRFFHEAGTRTIVEGDVNGDTVADFQIELQGIMALTAADFVL